MSGFEPTLLQAAVPRLPAEALGGIAPCVGLAVTPPPADPSVREQGGCEALVICVGVSSGGVQLLGAGEPSDVLNIILLRVALSLPLSLRSS